VKPGDLVIPLYSGTALEQSTTMCWPSIYYYDDTLNHGCVRGAGACTVLKSVALVVAVPGWPSINHDSQMILVVFQDRVLWTWAAHVKTVVT
jgi:hypothetical protein